MRSLDDDHYRSLFELAPIGVGLHDVETGQFLEVNDALIALTGFSREELLAMTFDGLVPGDATGEVESSRFETQERFGPVESECCRKEEGPIPVLLAGILANDGKGRTLAWSLVQDISARKEMESRVAESAMLDRLTGLANRARFNEQLKAAMTRIRNEEQQILCVLFLDFDRFKLVNDTMGHDAGDDLLRQIALRLRGSLRTSDAMSSDYDGNLIARFGGDEFVIVINDLKRRGDAVTIAERLLNALAPTYKVKGQEVNSSASIGIVTTENPAETPENIVRNADVAMYEAKRSGRGCAVVFNEHMHTRLARRVTLESGLRKALGTSQLSLVYQPIVDLQTGRMVFAEVFPRWSHPELGEVPTDEFIKVAEDRGLIVPLEDWILNESCRQLRRWMDENPANAPGMMCVNLSRVQFAQGSALVARIREILETNRLAPQCLQLEVTESSIAHDPDAARVVIEGFRSLGVRIAMDDFGTGTSSLACLREFRFDSVKIDRTFLADLTASRDMLAVLHTTVNLVENLGMASIAEGVESATQAALLQSLGCRYAQGYLYSEPVPAALIFASAAGGETIVKSTA